MKKTFGLALMLSVSVPCLAYAEAKASQSGGIYELKPETEVISKLKKADNSQAPAEESFSENGKPSAKIVREELSKNSYIEKLLNEEGKVIAAKTIQNNEVIQKELMFYYPTGKLQRKVTLVSNGTEFYAEDYYPNGKISSQANYLNEKNKIGREKKYDNIGTLRQELNWEVVAEDKKKPVAERKTVRRGKVISYYPNGNIAAVFMSGKKGNNIFYDTYGTIVREIKDAELLNFANEINPEDCRNNIVKLSLEDLVALYEDEGDISYNKCGLPYRENFTTEIMDVEGNIASKISYDDHGMIRKIVPYLEGRKEGLEQKFDADGNLTAEINYVSGKKNGMASGYFPTRETAFRKRYENGKVVGKLKCYFPNGKQAAEFSYQDGKKEGTAKIYGNQAREIEFANDKIVENADKVKKRVVSPSLLNEVPHPAGKCLNIDSKLTDLEQNVRQNVKSIEESFEVVVPFACRDFANFKPESSNYACYDATKQLRALYPTAYKRGKFASGSIYTKEGDLLYEVAYNNKQKQGFTRKYDAKRNLLAEMYFNQDKLSGSSRSYYPNGTTKELLKIEEERPHKFMVRYLADGKPEFSINYNAEKNGDAFIASKETEVYLKFNKGKAETIREISKEGYTDYNLLLGEYIKYENNEIVGGGKICGYDKLPEDVEIIRPLSPKAETKAAEPKIEEKATEPKVEEKATEPKVEVKAAEPKVEEKATEPKVEEKATEPKVEEKATEPKVEVKAAEPKVEEKATEPKVEVKATEPKVEVPNIAPAHSGIKTTTTAPQKGHAISDELPEYEEIAPIMMPEEAPIVEDLEEIPEEKYKNAIIPTAAEKKQAELAAKNIGPIAKPDIQELTDTVTKESAAKENKAQATENETLSHTDKFYYPNGKIRKTVTTHGNRTEEIKEYSKTGLMITDKHFQTDKIVIEKYYGSGEIRRKTVKGYDDNAVTAFVSREDFYNNGNIRYEIVRQPAKMMFTDKAYNLTGNLQQETTQNGAFSFNGKEYNKEGKIQKQIIQEGLTEIIREYDNTGKVIKFSLNGKTLPNTMSDNVNKLMQDNRKVYDKSNHLLSEYTIDGKKEMITEYHPNGKPETEISYYHNGEISIKVYAADGMLEKFAYLSPDGRLHIQKPEIREIPAYRERYWLDYNNPYWIENCDKYSIRKIARLNLDITSYILAELEAKVPEMIKQLYKKY